MFLMKYYTYKSGLKTTTDKGPFLYILYILYCIFYNALGNILMYTDRSDL